MPTPINQDQDQVLALGQRLQDVLEGVFREVVDHPDDVTVRGVLNALQGENRYNSRYSLTLEVRVHAGDIRQALGNAHSIQKGVQSFLVAVRGKNRVPIEFDVKAH